MSIMDSILNVFALGLAFAPVGLSVLLSKKILKISDLTCEASFGLGGCSYGIMVIFGINPLFAMILSMMFGYISGLMTSSMMSYIRFNSLVASMITAGIIQTILLKSNSIKGLNIWVQNSLLGQMSAINNLLLSGFIVLIITFLLFRIINSEYGLGMRIFGSGRIVSESLGINSINVLNSGLGISNMLSALGGILTVQITGEFPIGIGNGCFIFGLASMMLGEKLTKSDSIKSLLMGCFFSSIIMQCVIKFITYYGYDLGEEYRSIILAVTLIFLVAFKKGNQELTKENV